MSGGEGCVFHSYFSLVYSQSTSVIFDDIDQIRLPLKVASDGLHSIHFSIYIRPEGSFEGS